MFACTLPDGTVAAVIMVGAYNVGGTLVTVHEGDVARGDELGQFGFGSTAIVLIGKNGPTMPDIRQRTAPSWVPPSNS